MSYIKGLNIEANPELSKLQAFEDILKALSAGAEGLLQQAPYDSALNVKISQWKSGYRVAIELASVVFRFADRAQARSPFVALEQVFLSAHDFLQTWSINKVV